MIYVFVWFRRLRSPGTNKLSVLTGSGYGPDGACFRIPVGRPLVLGQTCYPYDESTFSPLASFRSTRWQVGPLDSCRSRLLEVLLLPRLPFPTLFAIFHVKSLAEHPSAARDVSMRKIGKRAYDEITRVIHAQIWELVSAYIRRSNCAKLEVPLNIVPCDRSIDSKRDYYNRYYIFQFR